MVQLSCVTTYTCNLCINEIKRCTKPFSPTLALVLTDGGVAEGEGPAAGREGEGGHVGAGQDRQIRGLAEEPLAALGVADEPGILLLDPADDDLLPPLRLGAAIARFLGGRTRSGCGCGYVSGSGGLYSKRPERNPFFAGLRTLKLVIGNEIRLGMR